MRDVITLLALFLFFASPGVSDASYLIKLKNGREFVTSRYWEEGGQIKFYSHGGVLGIDKKLISGIEESDRPVQFTEERPPKSEPSEKPEKKATTGSLPTEPKKADAAKEQHPGREPEL